MLKVFEAFAGIGTQRMALRNLGIEHEVVAIAEIDKFAIKSYKAIHGEVNNLGDISKVQADDIPDHDLFTYSFPCQDISIAGKQGGLEKGSDTRSSLLWECNRVIESKKPKYLMLENVKNLVGKKFKPSFDEWLEHLESLGYTNYWQVLNAKDYGVPQNRERVFVISILGEHEPYVFPEKYELTARLKDVLEEEVDEKFYLSEEKTEKLTLNMESPYTSNKEMNDGSDITHALDASYYKGKAPNDVGKGRRTQVVEQNEPIGIEVAGKLNHFAYRSMDEVLSPDGASTALNTMGGGDRQPKIIDTIKLFDIPKEVVNDNERQRRVYSTEGASPAVLARTDSAKVVDPKIAASRGRENGQQLEVNKHGTSNSLTTVQKDNYVVEPPFRIRKLTPKECWRLMGCSDEDFHKAEEVNSNTQLYKQAGNAIVVDVLEQLFGQLFR